MFYPGFSYACYKQQMSDRTFPQFNNNAGQPGQPFDSNGPFSGNFYEVHMELPCCQLCCLCDNESQLEISESADAEFDKLRPVATIKNTYQYVCTSSNTYNASIFVNNYELARSEKKSACCAPSCNKDEARFLRPNGQPLGRLVNSGCWSMVCQVLAADDSLQYRVETICCNNSCGYQLYKIYDSASKVVGGLTLYECEWCDFTWEVEMPKEANLDQRLMILLTVHHLTAVLVERQHEMLNFLN